ncbi:hypothetical protein [Azospirillum argentinense]
MASAVNALIAQGGGEGTDFLRAIHQGQQMAQARRQGEIQDVQIQKALREEERAQGQLNALAKLADQYQAAGDKETAGLIRAGGPAVFAKLLDQKMDPKAGYMAAGDVLYDLRGGSPKPVGGNIPMVDGQPYTPGLGTGGRGPVPTPGGGTFADRVVMRESGGDPNATNPNSTATGAGQFLEGTWLDLLPRHAPGVVETVAGPNADLKNPQVRAALLELRRDPELSKTMVDAYAKDNAAYLRSAGIDPTPANLTVAHFLGGAGATRFLQADPNAPATSVVSPDAVMANRNVFFDPKTNQPRTVGQLRQMAEQSVAGLGGGQGGATPQAQGQPQPSVTPMTDALGRPYTKDAPSGMMWGRDGQGRMVAMPIPGAEDRTQTLPPAEVQALGFPKGSVVQRDSRGKLTVASNGEGGPFTGNGMEAQALNTLITGDPATPEYAAAYAHMTQPKIMPVTQGDGSVQMMAVAPQLPPNIRQPAWMQGGGASPAASPGTPPQQGAMPPNGSPPAQQGGGAAAPGASAALGFTVTTVPGTQPRSPKFTEGETNAYGFYQRMRDAEKVIRDLESQGTASADLYDRAVSVLPDIAANWMHTEPFQKLDQARRDFINAQLRKESGAAIGQDEFNNAYRQYFPQSGDSASVIDQKRANRANAIDAMMKAGKSLVDYYDTKDGKGAAPAQGGGVEYDWDPGTKTLKMRK